LNRAEVALLSSLKQAYTVKIMEDPAYWSERAKEMRETACSASDKDMKANMEEIAGGNPGERPRDAP
jgi:hypothetical protein